VIDLVLESPGDQNFVRAIDENGIKIRDKYYQGSIVLTPDTVPTVWPPASMAELLIDHLEALFALRPEVALLGTGKDHAMLAQPLQLEIWRRGLNFEVMSTPAACRTFNLLVADGRRVVAGLLPA
jgi:uncharacterized protein